MIISKNAGTPLKGVSEARKKELLDKRKAYANNKNVYSLLMQYAAGFGKSNIIGWAALQLKDCAAAATIFTTRSSLWWIAFSSAPRLMIKC